MIELGSTMTIEQKINKYGPKDDQNYESYADLHGVYVR